MMSWRRGKAYAQDLRDRVLAAKGRLREVAERFGVSQAYVSRGVRAMGGSVRPALERSTTMCRCAWPG